IAYTENWDGPLKEHLKAHPDDPVSRLVGRDRAVIAELIPLLTDRSPTRSYRYPMSTTEHLCVPRVCDFALLLIEYHSLCKFHDNASTALLLHEIPDLEQEKIAKRIADWWAENKNK